MNSTMMELLQHLWPDFSAMFSAQTTGLSAWFWSATALIFAVSLIAIFIHYVRFRRRIRLLSSLLAGQNKETLALARRETLQKAEALPVSGVGSLWREFDESLVSSSDQKQLFNTLDAEHFFNSRTLAPGLTGSRLLAAAPSFLVAIGVLGTFVGLTVGLEGLVGTSDEVEALKGGINELISGAAVAFMSSVWGVAFSLALNFIEKMFERGALTRIRALQQRIDFLYPRIPAEQSLVHIAEYGKESKQALQELHERIGDRLQETLNGMSDAMQQAIVDALNNVMAPAIQTLVNTSSQQSSQVLESLMGRFMDGMASAGREQGAQMQQAAADVNSAVSSMSTRLNDVFSALSDQQSKQQTAVQEQAAQFESQLTRMSAASEQREQQMEQRFSQLVGGIGEQLESQLGAAQRLDQERQAAFEQIMQQTSTSHSALLEQVGGAARDQLRSVNEAADARQQQLESSLTAMLERMSDAFTSQGRQADQRERERQERLDGQLESVAAQQQKLLDAIATAVQATQEQSRQLAAQHQTLVTQLQQATLAVENSSQHMNSSAGQLGVLSNNLRQATEQLAPRLDQVASSITHAAERNAAVSDQLKRQAENLVLLQDTLVESAERFEQTAALARDGFGEMRQHQQAFLAEVRAEFTALGEALRTQVGAIEKQAEDWLQSYSTETSRQVHERMDQWNKETLGFATKMSAAVQAISNVVDELEAR
ncbi:anti-phage ZorAB system protein ZorA [Halopseudomonas sp.]|uniref:anti-phage ZorAB system protein ZorA n=1 Tax=Halopseudomonas sp. TaxID=2901191 RepID=UPI003FA54BFE